MMISDSGLLFWATLYISGKLGCLSHKVCQLNRVKACGIHLLIVNTEQQHEPLRHFQGAIATYRTGYRDGSKRHLAYVQGGPKSRPKPLLSRVMSRRDDERAKWNLGLSQQRGSLTS